MPIDPDKSPKVHVPPLNHIGLWVDDLPAAVEWMEGQGVRFTPGGVSVVQYMCYTLIYYYLYILKIWLINLLLYDNLHIFWQIRKGASGHNVTFIHPKGNEKCPIGGEGVLIELVQAPKEVIDALS